ncbi:MAG TPA: hypothetical protein VFN38_01750 [Gemmatimonadaceae bacterium]|nr:hypothetical protein [Gemmatimonadaceae bacterium]
MKRQLLVVSLGGMVASAGSACGHDAVGPNRSITGSYTLTRVYDIPMPSLVKDEGTQYRLLFRSGFLTLRPDSTFDMPFDAVFVDYPNIVINGHHFGSYHWTAESAKLELESPSTGFRLQGTAGADTVRLNLDRGYVRAPSPVYDYTFRRAPR